MAKTKASLAKMAGLSPRQDWTPAAIVAAMKQGRREIDRVAALKRSGILTKAGTVAKRYRKWGKPVTRTPKLEKTVG